MPSKIFAAGASFPRKIGVISILPHTYSTSAMLVFKSQVERFYHNL